jgi:hypothetical protein
MHLRRRGHLHRRHLQLHLRSLRRGGALRGLRRLRPLRRGGRRPYHLRIFAWPLLCAIRWRRRRSGHTKGPGGARARAAASTSIIRPHRRSLRLRGSGSARPRPSKHLSELARSGRRHGRRGVRLYGWKCRRGLKLRPGRGARTSRIEHARELAAARGLLRLRRLHPRRRRLKHAREFSGLRGFGRRSGPIPLGGRAWH